MEIHFQFAENLAYLSLIFYDYDVRYPKINRIFI